MKTTMRKKDLLKSDGFPSDILRHRTVVVQIFRNKDFRNNIILYSNKYGDQDQYILPNELSEKYEEGLYIIP